MKMAEEHQRLMEFVMDCIVNERHRQNEKWGMQRHDLGKWLAILAEEFGESAQAMQPMMGLTSTKDTDKDDLFAELIQVAAVAAAIAEQIKEERGWF